MTNNDLPPTTVVDQLATGHLLANDQLFFTVDIGTETRLLEIADGGETVKFVATFSNEVELSSFNNQLIVESRDSDAVQVWRTTSEGTLTPLATFSADTLNVELVAEKNGSYTFIADDAIYRSDGNAESTQQIGVFPTSPTDLIAHNDMIIYTADSEQGSATWSFDGDSFEVLANIPWRSESSTLRFLDGPLIMLEEGLDTNQYFREGFYSSYDFQARLLTSDGTTEGTLFLQDDLVELPELVVLTNGRGTYLSQGTSVYFRTRDRVSDPILTWKIDVATTDGVVEVTDSVEIAELQLKFDVMFAEERPPVPRIKYEGVGYRFAETNGLQYFVAWVRPDQFGNPQPQIVRHSDSEFSVLDFTQLPLSYAPQVGYGKDLSFAAANGLMYFTAEHPNTGVELWQTDGTLEGTKIVVDANPGPADSNAAILGVSEDAVFFSANDGVHGRELWALPLESPPPSSDLNHDGVVDMVDFDVLAANFAQNKDNLEDGDIDGNGVVDFADFLLLAYEFKQA